jgi:LysM repeat protein
MNQNERLLSRVLQERSGHHRPSGLGDWLLIGVVLLAVVGVVAGLQWVRTRADTVAAGGSAAGVAVTPMLSAQAAVATSSVRAVDTRTVQTNRTPRRYVVQPGDSIGSIAARNGLQPATLASVNDLDDPDVLQPGRELTLPATDGVMHVVQPGETLRQIADEYNVDLATIVAANDLSDPDNIPAGLRLFIPSPTAPTPVTARH